MRLPWPCELYLGALDIGLEVALHIHPHWTKFFLGMPILLWKWKFLNLFGEASLFEHFLSLLMWVTSHCRSVSPKTSLCHLEKAQEEFTQLLFQKKISFINNEALKTCFLDSIWSTTFIITSERNASLISKKYLSSSNTSGDWEKCLLLLSSI